LLLVVTNGVTHRSRATSLRVADRHTEVQRLHFSDVIDMLFDKVRQAVQQS
jgi:hypothetical protein